MGGSSTFLARVRNVRDTSRVGASRLASDANGTAKDKQRTKGGNDEDDDGHDVGHVTWIAAQAQAAADRAAAAEKRTDNSQYTDVKARKVMVPAHFLALCWHRARDRARRDCRSSRCKYVEGLQQAGSASYSSCVHVPVQTRTY